MTTTVLPRFTPFVAALAGGAAFAAVVILFLFGALVLAVDTKLLFGSALILVPLAIILTLSVGAILAVWHLAASSLSAPLWVDLAVFSLLCAAAFASWTRFASEGVPGSWGAGLLAVVAGSVSRLAQRKVLEHRKE